MVSNDAPSPDEKAPDQGGAPPRDEGGLECPRCGCRHLPVWATRRGRRHIRRTRICRNCGRQVITRERI